jgi:hypothetical protein
MNRCFLTINLDLFFKNASGSARFFQKKRCFRPHAPPPDLKKAIF